MWALRTRSALAELMFSHVSVLHSFVYVIVVSHLLVSITELVWDW